MARIGFESVTNRLPLGYKSSALATELTNPWLGGERSLNKLISLLEEEGGGASQKPPYQSIYLNVSDSREVESILQAYQSNNDSVSPFFYTGTKYHSVTILCY